MSSTTLILFWDEVFETLVLKIKDILSLKQQEFLTQFLEQGILTPLYKLLAKSLNMMIELLQQTIGFTLWTDMIDQILRVLYIVIVFYIGGQCLVLIYRYLYSQNSNKGGIKKLFEKIIGLHILHFLIRPMIMWGLEHYHDFMQLIHDLIHSGQDQFIYFDQHPRGQQTLLLEVICLVIVLYAVIKLMIQFLQQGFTIVMALIKCYTIFFYEYRLHQILGPLKRSLIQIYLVYSLQRILLVYTITMYSHYETILQLFQVLSLFIVAQKLPHYFKYDWEKEKQLWEG